MRQRMMILAAALVVALAASTASAQAPTEFKAPLQTPAASAPAAFASGCSAPVVVNGCGGCACTTTHEKTKCSLRISPGTVNPVGCSCFAAQRTFFWGGCHSFWNPQQTCGNGCGGGGCGNRFGNHCPLPEYGHGLGAPANNCGGPFSYIMR
jgi:hypothetical protein